MKGRVECVEYGGMGWSRVVGLSPLGLLVWAGMVGIDVRCLPGGLV